MITKVKDCLEQYHMIDKGDEVIVGLSGGADSVCLLFLLSKLSDAMEFSLKGVHVNHGLREESKEEEQFVQKLCKNLGIPLIVKHINVKKYVLKHQVSIEEGARELRYEAFIEEKNNAISKEKVKIALAHHKNDQAETVLFHLLRGSSLKGLTGMAPVRGIYIRPLLFISKKEIEDTLQKYNISYVTDQSNFDTVYARNFIRHNLIKDMEDKICKETVSHIARTAEDLRSVDDFVQNEVNNKISLCIEQKDEEYILLLTEWQKEHPYIQNCILYEILGRIAGKKKDITSLHIELIRDLVTKQSGKRIQLIYQICIQKEYDTLRFTKLMEQQKSIHKEGIRIQENANIILPDDLTSHLAGKSINCRILEYSKGMQIPNKTYTKWFDYDKINNCLMFRTRQQGDYFYPINDGTKKIKAFMIERKIPVSKRDEMLLVADGSHIIWIPGERISCFTKVSETTKTILELSIDEGEENG